MQKKLGGKDIENILSELKKELRLLYQDRFVSLILYGSYARAEASENSDIDVVVVLKDKVVSGQEIDRMLDVITDLNLKYNTLISIYPVSDGALQTMRSPLFLNVLAEGIRV